MPLPPPPSLFVITDLASPPPLEPHPFLTFSDIYPLPQRQRPGPQPPTCRGVAVWISMLDVVEYEREGARQTARQGENARGAGRKAPTAGALPHTIVYFYDVCSKHHLCPAAAGALICVCLRPPSMTRSWEERTCSEGEQRRQRQSRKAVNK